MRIRTKMLDGREMDINPLDIANVSLTPTIAIIRLFNKPYEVRVSREEYETKLCDCLK